MMSPKKCESDKNGKAIKLSFTWIGNIKDWSSQNKNICQTIPFPYWSAEAQYKQWL